MFIFGANAIRVRPIGNERSVATSYPNIINEYRGDENGRIAEEEELIQPGDQNGPDNTNEPSPERAHGHVDVVGICDCSSHFGVGRVILCPVVQHSAVEG